MLLALDTATTAASVAIYNLESGALLAESTWQARRRHTQDLLAEAQRLLAQVGRAPAQITALASTTGPGSFTGVRIGLSALKGIGLGLAQPPRVVGVPTLAVTAAPWVDVASASGAQICAYIQAGRGRYNWCFFERKDSLWRPSAADHRAGTAGELAATLAGIDAAPIWLVGEPAPDLSDAAAALAHVTLVDAVSAWRRAGHLAHLAAQHLAQGVCDDLAALQPLYLQNP
ncbi:MAG: tRNA (adenosine(37)-N6)-threonylcarbamoyltransferase complex dimerization subunit type 1 TsaB [Caldilineaceae bacterium]|nr:tRNA (adenosine(37)-N6)-threonylcarbamoyltransferase complex dimerization subunit type 1 TsaB [Caldilineaceae bacterium]